MEQLKLKNILFFIAGFFVAGIMSLSFFKYSDEILGMTKHDKFIAAVTLLSIGIITIIIIRLRIHKRKL